MNTSYDRISRILIETYSVDKNRINPSASFDDLKLDSLDKVEFTIEVEKEFDIQIPDEDIEKIVTISDACNYVEQSNRRKDVVILDLGRTLMPKPTK